VRVVADTNTVVSGLLWDGGPPRQLIDAAFAAEIELYTSAVLLEELTEVLGRAKFGRKVAASSFSAEQLVWRYARLARRVVPAAVESVVLSDPDDDHVITCAVAARAEIIVSGDRRLLEVGVYRDIRIVHARQALELIPKRRHP
jgi:putative PIN family toxin of toxin-antitoxin system